MITKVCLLSLNAKRLELAAIQADIHLDVQVSLGPRHSIARTRSSRDKAANVVKLSATAYGSTSVRPWISAPQVYMTLGTYPARSVRSGRSSGSVVRARSLVGSSRSRRQAPIE